MADIGTKHKGIDRRDCVVWETHNMAAACRSIRSVDQHYKLFPRQKPANTK